MTSVYDDALNVAKNYGMSPSFLSRLAMLAILPATQMERKPRLAADANPAIYTQFKHEGMDTVEIGAAGADPAKEYQIYFGGNSQDNLMAKRILKSSAECEAILNNVAIHNGGVYPQCYPTEFYTVDDQVLYHLPKDPTKTNIFWNYPGVGESAGCARGTDDLVAAGCAQVQRLLDKAVDPSHISLSGMSLGGGIAAQVAQRFQAKNIMLKIVIDRSFSSLAAVVAAHIDENIGEKPLGSVCAPALYGAALGAIVAGLIASVGVLAAALIKAIGGVCSGALGEFMPNVVIKVLDNIIDSIAAATSAVINLCGSIIGGVLLVAGLLGGVVLGLLAGALLSLQYLWSSDPTGITVKPALSLVLNALCCELNSVAAINDLIKARAENVPTTISVINTLDDNVILIPAALNSGMGNNAAQVAKSPISSFWYTGGGHCNTLEGKPLLLAPAA